MKTNQRLVSFLTYPATKSSQPGIDTASILKTYLKGPDIITGGEYGPENSILGTVVFLAGALLIRRLKLGVSPEIQTALQEHAEKVYIEHRG